VSFSGSRFMYHGDSIQKEDRPIRVGPPFVWNRRDI